jgi:predicted TIM-barrel fold metal-dependent hydrolase
MRVQLRLALVALLLSKTALDAQTPRRVIDMHVHAFSARWGASAAPFNHTTGKPSIALTGAMLESLTVAHLNAHNVHLAVLSGPLAAVRDWRRRAPGRFLGAPQFPMTYLRADSAFQLEQYYPSIPELRASVRSGDVGAIGEITAQYLGLAPDDSTLAPYFALAAELDLPVGIHTGTGPPAAHFQYPRHRLSVGDPLVLEPVLLRHPRLRVYLMHAGYPYLASTIAILHKFPQVYADLSAINWRLERAQFHEYLRALVINGFGNRLMFGSDGEAWPEAIGLAIEAIETATFLTEAQKSDIFYNNAARFLKLRSP